MTETIQWVIKGVYIAMAVALAISNVVAFFKKGKWKKMFKKENIKLDYTKKDYAEIWDL